MMSFVVRVERGGTPGRAMARGIARYRQVAAVVREQIERGAYPARSRIPPEHELAETFGVSRATVREAIGELVREGLLVREQGRGTFVVGEPGNAGLVFSGSLEDLVRESRRMKVASLQLDHGCAPPGIAALLDRDPDAISRVLRIRELEGAPLSWTENYLPREIGERLRPRDLRREPLLQLLRERYGIAFGRARQSVRASLAEPTVATGLDIAIGAPVLDVERIMFDDRGKPFEVVRSIYRADRYAYVVELRGEHRDLLRHLA